MNAHSPNPLIASTDPAAQWQIVRIRYAPHNAPPEWLASVEMQTGPVLVTCCRLMATPSGRVRLLPPLTSAGAIRFSCDRETYFAMCRAAFDAYKAKGGDPTEGFAAALAKVGDATSQAAGREGDHGRA